MMKKFLLLSFLISISLFAQEKEGDNPSVELPDFVITGKYQNSVQTAKKLPPDFVSTITDDFLKPSYSPEEMDIKNIENPIEQDLKLLDSLNYLQGKIDVGIGLYSIPVAALSYAYLFEDGIFEGHFAGEYQREYIDQSSRYGINGGAKIQYLLWKNSGFLTNSRITLNGDYSTKSFKFFGSSIPDEKRSLNSGFINLSLDNYSNENFNYLFKFSDTSSTLSEEKFSENIFNIQSYTKFIISHFNLGIDLNYQNQTKTDSLGDGGESFFFIRPKLELGVADFAKVAFGFTYENSGNKNFTSPYAALAMMLDKNISLFAEYHPEAEFISVGSLLNNNEYFNPQNYNRVFFEKSSAINISVKYEYERYFQIDGGVKYYSTSNNPYFFLSQINKKYELGSTEAKYFSGFINFIFHPGPFGVFYGSTEVLSLKDTANNFVPFVPSVKINFAYGYDFNFGLSGEVNLDYRSNRFTDINNIIEIDDYINLKIKLSYLFEHNLFFTLTFENLLDSQNYRWANYIERPFDITAGIRYTW